MVYNGIAIGNRAFEARKSKGLKQREISTALGIHQATYSKFELGQYDMPLSQVIKLCNILDVSVPWLIGVDIIPDLTDKERLELENYKNYLVSKRK
jgi:transcriptional regulator with XRE-family HTH domain